MTRINVVPVEELCDQHLLAEHREITRIPNCIDRGRYSLEGQPSEYTLGKGHVKFFYDKLGFLFMRHRELHLECVRRGFNVQDRWPSTIMSYEPPFDRYLFNDYTPTEEALAINRARIQERMPAKARWTKVER
jgi:hypothetical protein